MGPRKHQQASSALPPFLWHPLPLAESPTSAPGPSATPAGLISSSPQPSSTQPQALLNTNMQAGVLAPCPHGTT